MRCPKCGQENTAGSAFCRFCGSKLSAPSKKRRKPASPSSGPVAKTSSPSNDTKAQGVKRRIRWGRVALLATVGILVAGFGYGGYIGYQAWQTLPSVQSMVSLQAMGQDSVIYDRFGQPVARLHGTVNRVNVPLSEISPNLQHALVAIEDHSFYTNPGFDITSILRAAFVDIIHRRAVQGASTLTEQLAKDLYLSDKKTLVRKAQEFMIGLELAHTYTKQQILDMYLNEVYLGDGASGVYSASKAYFDETPSQLTLAQAAMLAGLPQAPSLYDPLVNLKLAKQRQLQVLNAMVKYGYISKAQANQAYAAPLNLHPVAVNSANSQIYPYPWYVDKVIQVLEQQGFSGTQIFDGGLKIYTALDPTIYNIAQNAVDQTMNYNFGPSQSPNPTYQAAAVVEDPHNGDILAVIGGRTFSQPFMEDLATNPSVQRSTGSSIKPLLEYAPAIAKGYTQMSVIQDVPIFHVNGQWWPHNDNHLYRGYLTLRDALAISDNDVAVHLLHDIGLDYGYYFAKNKFGLPLTTADLHAGLGIAIGGLKEGFNVLEMTQAYATFPNNGVRMTPIWVTKVVNPDGAVVFQDSPHGTVVLTPQQDYIMEKMMERVMDPNPIPSIGPGSDATGINLGIGRPAAGKTGTNNGEADAWFLGYTPQLMVGVWEGNRKGEYRQPATPNGPAYGDVAAGPIWQKIMEQVDAQEHLPVEHFPRPSGMVYLNDISITSGKIASQYAPPQDVEGAWFIKGTQPTTIGDTHYPVKVLARNPNELWQQGCGAYVTTIALRRESDWHPGGPYIWDSRYWAPTKMCTPSTAPSKTSPSTSPSSSPSSPSATAAPSTPSTPPSSPASSIPPAPVVAPSPITAPSGGKP
ncbi:PBP1A family penicillin-binding protein [Sulfobacillus sp. hq2]|uniref:PBP1A family penicillin-binding protein n=1 Tax=Sulfobacillus sp. hq2 TaxID=2039167 RepID=UPI000CD0755D|nr:PBP1A family penicillin-binding protein [Sulfobacillus sp. hq2]POB09174.1 peptidoglycan glycosyltransferase [Sulfobacillus sp. hq2]